MTGSEDSAAQLLQIERAFAAPIQAVRRLDQCGRPASVVARRTGLADRGGGGGCPRRRSPAPADPHSERGDLQRRVSAGLSRSSGGQVFAGQVTMAGWT